MENKNLEETDVNEKQEDEKGSNQIQLKPSMLMIMTGIN